MKNKTLKWMLNILLVLLFVQTAIAVTGSGTTIDMSASVSAISFSNNVTYGNSGIVGLYNGTNIDGSFGIFANINTSNSTNNTNNTQNITLTLIAPTNNKVITDYSYLFTFNLSSTQLVNNCSIYLNDTLKGTVINASNGMHTFNVTNLSGVNYKWNITCDNVSSNTRNIIGIITSGFDNSSTDLSTVDLNAVANLTLSKPEASIVFSGNTNLSSGIDFVKNIKISALSVYVNSSAASMLNKSATIRISSVPYNAISIWKDGILCTTCSVLNYSSGTLYFNVTGFSNYSIQSQTKLSIWDDTDTLTKYANRSVVFYANYSNVSSSALVDGNCTITFTTLGLGPFDMTLNGNIYIYNTSFNDTGIGSYNISCTPTDAGYDALSVTDTYAISSTILSSFSTLNATIVNSSRMELINNAENTSAIAGNVSEMHLDGTAITSNWQGFYGSITSTISLSSANGSVFYNWSSVVATGEIYASRQPNIYWTEIHCANDTTLNSENSYLNISYLDSDSLHNTFNTSVGFPEFYVGNVHINGTDCYATKLYASDNSSYYSEVLLTDDNYAVYTTIINNDALGFNGNMYDFQLLVPENGNNAGVTKYYLYMELG